MPRFALAALAALLTACSAGVGGDWPGPPKGVLADCHAFGDRCGGSGWCGATEDDRPICCSVPPLDGIHCPWNGPAEIECEADADCPPNPEPCHAWRCAPSGVCESEVIDVRTTCTRGETSGICTEDGMCAACASDEECQATIHDECYTSTCAANGACVPSKKPLGAPCNITAGGMCNDSAACVVD